MSDEPIPLARPELGQRERDLVDEVLASGRLSLGPMQDRFEVAFAAWLGVENAVAVSSGTAALHLGVRALGWGAGDRVVTSPFSFVASANCLLYESAEPLFCDIDPVTLNVDPAAARAAIDDAEPGERERIRGILPVHIFGQPAAMPELQELAAAHDLGVLEDACEAPGAVDADGARVGARGNIATFAFYANKQLTTGEGGMMIARDPDEAARLRSERNQGRAVDMGWLDHDRLGFNYRMSELQAALGIGQVERADELLAARAAVAAGYAKRLSELGGAPAGEGDASGLVLPCADRGDERRSWFVYTVRLPAGTDRERVIARLADDGIASKAYLPCIHLMPHYRERFGFRGGEFPVAEEVASRSLALPFFPRLSTDQIDRVCERLDAALTAA